MKQITINNADKEWGGGSEINYSNNDTVHTAETLHTSKYSTPDNKYVSMVEEHFDGLRIFDTWKMQTSKNAILKLLCRLWQFCNRCGTFSSDNGIMDILWVL